MLLGVVRDAHSVLLRYQDAHGGDVCDLPMLTPDGREILNWLDVGQPGIMFNLNANEFSFHQIDTGCSDQP